MRSNKIRNKMREWYSLGKNFIEIKWCTDEVTEVTVLDYLYIGSYASCIIDEEDKMLYDVSEKATDAQMDLFLHILMVLSKLSASGSLDPEISGKYCFDPDIIFLATMDKSKIEDL